MIIIFFLFFCLSLAVISWMVWIDLIVAVYSFLMVFGGVLID